MSDGVAKQQLLSRLRPDDNDLWSIVAYLANTPEMDRRRILRPHAEAGFQLPRDVEIIKLRQRLDAALGLTTLLEIAYELGIVTDMEVAEAAGDTVPSRANLEKLFQSEAMLHYANAYSYLCSPLSSRTPDWAILARLNSRVSAQADFKCPAVLPCASSSRAFRNK